MRTVALVLFLVAAIPAYAVQPSVIKCTGSFWEYYHELSIVGGKAKCRITNYINRETGKVSVVNQDDSTKCWESLARIQVDGAQCCFTSSKGNYYAPGAPLCK